jgi:hypothetical protein
MNDGETPFTNTFQQFCATRWLGRGKVLYNIVTQWWDLKAYFDMAQAQAPQKERYRARELARMLADTSNLLYFHFLTPIITEMEEVNKAFQTSNPDMNELFKLLDLLYKSLRVRIYDLDGKKKHVLRVDCGVKFDDLGKNMDQGLVREVRERCSQFLHQLVEEMEKRLHENKDILKGLNLFTPEKISSAMFRDLPFQGFCPDVVKAENEFRKIKLMQLIDLGFDNNEVVKPVRFWAKVAQYEVEGELIFKHISTYALNCLSLPVSNAYVERVFSLVCFIKDKFSNRMGLPILDALLILRTHLQAHLFPNVLHFIYNIYFIRGKFVKMF